jgi:2,3-bisphosphoglycerate-independent phosphoglycerate mutase
MPHPMEPSPILLIFLDGVGLGAPDPAVNPFFAADLPNLRALAGGRRLESALPRFDGDLLSFIPTDANLGVDGDPESATGQAVIFTGENIPRRLGTHYGPKPNRRIMALLRRHNLVQRLVSGGLTAKLWNAYPPAYFESICSGRRLFSVIPLAFHFAGVTLCTDADLQQGKAISADFTGRGWRTRLHLPGIPILSARDAGRRLVELACGVDFSAVDHWPTDYAGHLGEMRGAVRMLESLDRVIGGLVEAMSGTALTVVFTSDHGNLEDLAHRGHTRNPVPTLILGPREHRIRIADAMEALTGFAPAVLDAFQIR